MDLKDLLFGACDNDDHSIIKQHKISIGFICSMVCKKGYTKQGNTHTIIRMDRWGDKCQVHTLWDNLRLITSESDSHFND